MIGLLFPAGWYFNAKQFRYEAWDNGRVYHWVSAEAVLNGGDTLWDAIARRIGVRLPVFEVGMEA